MIRTGVAWRRCKKIIVIRDGEWRHRHHHHHQQQQQQQQQSLIHCIRASQTVQDITETISLVVYWRAGASEWDGTARWRHWLLSWLTGCTVRRWVCFVGGPVRRSSYVGRTGGRTAGWYVHRSFVRYLARRAPWRAALCDWRVRCSHPTARFTRHRCLKYVNL